MHNPNIQWRLAFHLAYPGECNHQFDNPHNSLDLRIGHLQKKHALPLPIPLFEPSDRSILNKVERNEEPPMIANSQKFFLI